MALPGAERIRVPDADARRYQWLADTVAARCQTFLALPGFDSLYLFTGSEPPTMFNTNNWMAMFDAAKQTSIRDTFARMPAPLCVVRYQKGIRFWSGNRAIAEGPLVRYIDESFVSVETRHGYELMRQR